MTTPGETTTRVCSTGLALARYRIGVDTGGTFTDLVVVDEVTGRLAPGDQLAGPCIVEQPDTTTVVYPGQQAAVDAWGNLLISAAASQREIRQP